MRLRTRSLLSFSISILIFLAIEVPMAFWITQRRVEHLSRDVWSSFAPIQDDYVGQRLSRVVFYLELKAEALDALTSGHAGVDSIRSYLQGGSPRLLDPVFADASLRGLEVDLAILMDPGGRVLISREVPSVSTSPAVALSPRELASVGPGGPYADPPATGARGYERILGSPMMISAYPVFADGGGRLGVLVFGRRQDARACWKDSARVGVEFSLQRLSDTAIPADGRAALTAVGTQYVQVPEGMKDLAAAAPPSDYVRGYRLLTSGGDDPLVLAVVVPPDLLKQPRLFVQDQVVEYRAYALVYLAGIVLTNLILFAVLYLVLDRVILARVFQINRSALRIVETAESTDWIHQEGEDELTMIGGSFNAVLRSLRARQRELTAANRRVRLANREIAISHQALQLSLLPVVVTDADGRITRVNRAFESVYGYTAEEAVGRPSNLLNPGRAVYLDYGLDDDAYDSLFQGLWRDVLSDQAWEGTLFNRAKGGEILPMQVVIHAIRSEEDGRLGFVAWMINLSKRIDAEDRVRVEVYRAISELAEARDSDTGAHLKRIAALARALAAKLGWGPRRLRELSVFAPLHDVGKVGIPDDVLLAPGRLTPEQAQIMKTHTEIGYTILRDRPTMEMAAEIARYHHERWDGLGYPAGLKGQQIPQSARIVAVVDVFDALRSPRPYKEGWPLGRTLTELAAMAGSYLDPELVALFLVSAEEFEAIYRSYVAEAT